MALEKDSRKRPSAEVKKLDKPQRFRFGIYAQASIKYYISTGAIQADHQLPAVNALAKELGINFETVRKAYKELLKNPDATAHMKPMMGIAKFDAHPYDVTETISVSEPQK